MKMVVLGYACLGDSTDTCNSPRRVLVSGLRELGPDVLFTTPSDTRAYELCEGYPTRCPLHDLDGSAQPLSLTGCVAEGNGMRTTLIVGSRDVFADVAVTFAYRTVGVQAQQTGLKVRCAYTSEGR